MTSPTLYLPPDSASIHLRQNDTEALRLLIAQRRLYRQAKHWLTLRWIGMAGIGITAPVLAVIWPSLAVAAGAVAGAWLFLGRTALAAVQNSLTVRAASVQEQFDFYVFQMPERTPRSTLPTLEEVAAAAGPDDQLASAAEKERLLDWYSVDAADPGEIAVAIAQRANASYTDGLLRTTAIAWGVALGAWSLVLLILTLVLDISPTDFLLGVTLPLLPAFLDIAQYIRGVWRSAEVRRDLVREIEEHLTGNSAPVEGQDLLVWQERLFSLRSSAPEVPDFLYNLRRNVNERSMQIAASQLSRRARKSS